jgi:hypothetical protein
MQVYTPPVFMFYCRKCELSRWHAPRKTVIVCVTCGHKTSSVEVVCTYAVDDYAFPDPELLPPRNALPSFMFIPPPEPVEPDPYPELEYEDWLLLEQSV